MLAWRRSDVEQLNWLAHLHRRAHGQLTGPILSIDDALDYQAGDRIVTLAPAADRSFVTSERGTVTSVDVDERALWVRFDDGRTLPLVDRELDPDRLAHGYAITVHRAQGATVDTAHVYEDGGGRELAYVKASRARHTTHIYVTADDVDQAVDDLQRDWAHETRQRWVIDTHHPAPATDSIKRHELTPLQHAARRLQLDAERWAVNALIPPDVTDQLNLARRRVAHLGRDLEELAVGRYRYDERVSNAGTERMFARHKLHLAQQDLERPLPRGRAGRDEHANRLERIRHAQTRAATAEQIWNELAAPIETRLRSEFADARAAVDDFTQQQQQRVDWITEHPEARRRLTHLEQSLQPVIEQHHIAQRLARQRTVEPEIDHGLGLGL
jgi:hypothetical protein